MKYCRYCGGGLDDKASLCVHCGKFVEEKASQTNISKSDESSLAFSLLGFFLPIVGFILYAVFCSDSPKKAKSALNGALVGVVVSVVGSIVMSMLSTIFDLIFWNSFFEIFEEILYEFY